MNRGRARRNARNRTRKHSVLAPYRSAKYSVAQTHDYFGIRRRRRRAAAIRPFVASDIERISRPNINTGRETERERGRG